MVESLTRRADRDAPANRLLKICDLDDRLPTARARRAATFCHRARRGSAVDAIVVASAEPGGTVLTQDRDDLVALALHSDCVRLEVMRPEGSMHQDSGGHELDPEEAHGVCLRGASVPA